MKTIRATAQGQLKGFCRVCPVCNGVACAGEVPGMGGIGTGAAFRANLASLAALRLNMRLLHDIATPDPATKFLGHPLDIPVLAAPIGGVSFNMGGALSEDDYILAKLKGCRQRGILGCTGDGVPPFIHEAAFAALRAVAVQGQIAILADGGIRSGVDVLKMIALGAHAVLIGRPFSIATIGGLTEGVVTYIDQIKNELLSAMVLTGCPDIASVHRDILRPATG